MSAKLATWLRVTPSPTTLAESSAIYQALSKQGRVSVFARCKDSVHEQVDNTQDSSLVTTFYAVFPHEPPTLRRTFKVPVYHGLPSARDEDPFNIRGLRNRKPMPEPKTFSCKIEKIGHKKIKALEEDMVRGHPYHGHFTVEKNGCLEDVLVEMNAPPGLARGCGTRIQDDHVAAAAAAAAAPREPDEFGKIAPKSKARKINMGSLMDMWREATSQERDNADQKASSKEQISSKSGLISLTLLDADTPLGKSLGKS